MKKILMLILILATGLPSAADGIGTTVGEFLRSERGAKIPAYGGAGVGLSGDLFAVQNNPAALAGLDRYEFALERDQMILDISGNHVSLGGPLGRRFALGLSYTGIDYGSTLRTTTTDPAAATGATFDGQDRSVGVVFGMRVGNSSPINLGLTLKTYQMEIDQYQADGPAFDFGIQWQPSRGRLAPLRLGASVINLGPKTTFFRAEESLPTTWRLGGAWTGHLGGTRLEAALDLVGGTGQDVHVQTGAGIWIGNVLALRLGYDGTRDIDNGFSGGAGLEWKDLVVDYAYLPYGDLGTRNRISMKYLFGNTRPPAPSSSSSSKSRLGKKTSASETTKSPSVPEKKPAPEPFTPARTAAAPPAASRTPTAEPSPYLPPAKSGAPSQNVKPSPAPAVESLHISPPTKANREVWTHLFTNLASLDRIQLSVEAKAQYFLDLSFVDRNPAGKWTGVAILRDRKQEVVDSLVLDPPSETAEDAAGRITAWLWLGKGRK
ncbi:MAG: hypothetical protein D6679_09130 [Candidatus Hydrogenedentota bacterium]|nr:MAG: hypothetical protein D6679_09130 [Candidatus Hydrogenedentota bacterium]